MRVEDIIDIIEAEYPPSIAENWDNVGLLVGDAARQTKKIMLALDATDSVIEQAVDQNVDLLITHHPLIFHGMKRVTSDDFIGRRILKLAERRITYYAMHTNYDSVSMGREAAACLGLEEIEILSPSGEWKEQEVGIGITGILPVGITLEALAGSVKKAFHLDSVRFYGYEDCLVKKVAMVPGAGSSEIERAVALGADVLITGDISHHTGIDTVAQGLLLIDAGHYGLEHIFAVRMHRFLQEHLTEESVEIVQAEEGTPFHTI